MSVGSLFTLPNEIVEAVCEAWGVSRRDMYRDVRFARIVEARHVTFYVLRRLTTFSYPEIALEFGKDHTTVMHGVRKITERLPTDEELRKRVATVVAYLEERKKQWQTTNSVRSTTSSGQRPA